MTIKHTFNFLIAGFLLCSLTSCPDDDDKDEWKQESQNQNSNNGDKGDNDPGKPENNQGSKEPVFSSGKIGGYYYVDLGLSVKWATCNVGADINTDYGDYYAWGELATKSSYSVENYRWSTGKWDAYTKYNNGIAQQDTLFGIPDHLTTLLPADDVATLKWGSEWRMPTYDELFELIDSCEWEEVENLNGTDTNGLMGTSKVNGNKIFLPAAGYITEDKLYWKGEHCCYWSSSLGANRCVYAHNFSYVMKNDKDYYRTWHLTRDYGISVRAVVK